jgi:hypothetical protein
MQEGLYRFSCGKIRQLSQGGDGYCPLDTISKTGGSDGARATSKGAHPARKSLRAKQSLQLVQSSAA